MKFVTLILLVLVLSFTALAQQQIEPEKTVAGFSLLGDETAARAALQGFSPRYETDSALPKYFFYNEYGNQVMALTAHSKERPFLITAIEVFGVDTSYQKKHYQLKSVASFASESGFFLGARPSAGSLIFGVPNTTSPKDVIRKKGAPQADDKAGKKRTLRYNGSAVKQAGNAKFASYAAEYEFYKNKLSRFKFTAIEAAR